MLQPVGRLCPHRTTLKIGQDVAFVPPETADMMEEQVGGMQGALQEADEKMQETAQKTTEKLQEKAETADQKLQEASQKASEKLDRATTAVEPTERLLLPQSIKQRVGVFVGPSEQTKVGSSFRKARS